MSSKNDQVKLRQIFGDAKQRIEIISVYVTSQNLVVDDPTELGEIKKAAANELYDIKVSLDETIQSKEKSTEESGDFFRGFFLLYKMNYRLANFLRISFLFILFASILWSIFVTYSMFVPIEGSEPSPDDTIINLIGQAFLVLPVVLVAMLVRWVALKVDQPVTNK